MGSPRTDLSPRKLVIDNSEVLELASDLTGKRHELLVGLPASYGRDDGRRYPVVYLLDGQWDFNLVNALLGGLVYDQVVPETIVVGLSYGGDEADHDALRRDDYTPTRARTEQARAPTGGGGPRFLEFLAKSVLPTIESRYRVDPAARILGGHSLGGLFVLYALFERPGLFHSYLSLSPAVGWDDRYLFERERDFRSHNPALGCRLWLSVGDSEWPHFTRACREFFAQMSDSPYRGVTLQTRLVQGERHSGCKPESFNRALRFAFADWAASQRNE